MAHIRMKNYGGIKYPDILQIMQNGQFINGFTAIENVSYDRTSYGISIDGNYRGINYRRTEIFSAGAENNYYIKINSLNELYPKFLDKYSKLNITFRFQDGRTQPKTNKVVYLNGTQIWQGPADNLDHTYNYITTSILAQFRLMLHCNTYSSNQGQMRAMVGNMYLSN